MLRTHKLAHSPGWSSSTEFVFQRCSSKATPQGGHSSRIDAMPHAGISVHTYLTAPANRKPISENQKLSQDDHGMKESNPPCASFVEKTMEEMEYTRNRYNNAKRKSTALSANPDRLPVVSLIDCQGDPPLTSSSLRCLFDSASRKPLQTLKSQLEAHPEQVDCDSESLQRGTIKILN